MADALRWLDAVLGDTADGLYVVDHRHRIVRWNRGAERLIGHRAEEVLGQHCHEVVAGCNREGRPVCGPDCAVHRCVERDELPKSMELRVSTKDGRQVWLHVSGIVIPHEGSPLIAHVLHDVSLGRQAVEAMSQVASVLSANGVRPSADEADLGNPGSGRRSSAPDAGESRLTPREREVLRAIASGLSNGAIATQLGVSRFTVRSHVQHILDKAGVHNRSEAVAFAFRNHLL
jgi:PAS domain S-box-containing protein